MKSRQTYLYGVAFHITGDERYLEYARAGVAWLREHAYERETGSAVTYWSGGKPSPPPDQRTTQDTFRDHPPPKIFSWKNGYHQMEHALVALITTAGLTGQHLPLYYAFVKPPPRERIQPYYFSGTIAGERDHPLPRHPGFSGRRVEFRDLR